MRESLEIGSLRTRLLARTITATALIDQVLTQIREWDDPAIWIFSASNSVVRGRASPAPTAPFLPEIWPRLEEGALICKSRDDLVRYQTQIANGSRERSVDWSLWPVSRCWHCHFPRIQNRQKNLMWRSTRVLSP